MISRMSLPVGLKSPAAIYFFGDELVSIGGFRNTMHIEAYNFFKMCKNIKWRRLRYGCLIEILSISQLSNTEMFR